MRDIKKDRLLFIWQIVIWAHEWVENTLRSVIRRFMVGVSIFRADGLNAGRGFLYFFV